MSAEAFFRDALATTGITLNGDDPWDLQVRESRAYERILRHGSIGFGEAFTVVIPFFYKNRYFILA